MKSVNKLLLSILIIALFLTGCGGGGGGSSSGESTEAEETPFGTVVNLVPYKSVMSGKAAGEQYSAILSGTDSNGVKCTGTYDVIADGPATYQDKQVTVRREHIVLTYNSITQSELCWGLYLADDGSYYMSVCDDGTTIVPIVPSTLPDHPKVGDFGYDGLSNISDGTIRTGTWEVNADYNGGFQLALYSSINKDDVVIRMITKTITFDRDGSPTYIKMMNTWPNGYSVTLSGSRVN